MLTLLADDDFTYRRFLARVFSSYGVCDVAVNGKEALAAFEAALDEASAYDLVCLAALLPDLDAHEVIRALRDLEASRGIEMNDRAKIIVTGDVANTKIVMVTFRAGCESYLVKPDRERLCSELEKLGLIG